MFMLLSFSIVHVVHLMNVEQHQQHQVAADPQTKPTDLGCEFKKDSE